MTPEQIAAGYRKHAALWRSAAARMKSNAKPGQRETANKVAARWEERAAQFDDDADMYDAQARIIHNERHTEA